MKYKEIYSIGFLKSDYILSMSDIYFIGKVKIKQTLDLVTLLPCSYNKPTAANPTKALSL